MENNKTLVEFQHVSKEFAGNTAVNNLNLTIQNGELFVLVGPSGSGKTTTLKMINSLEKPTGGTILFDHKDLASYNILKLRWKIGYVLQQIALFPNMSVAQNIALIPELQHQFKSRNDRINLVNNLLTSVDLDPKTYAIACQVNFLVVNSNESEFFVRLLASHKLS